MRSSCPDALRNDREERFPQEALDGLRETGFVGMTIGERWGGGGRRPADLLPVHRGAQPRRRQRALDHVGAPRAGRRLDRTVGDRGAEGAVAAADGHRRGARLLRPDRARPRFQPGRPARDGRCAARWRLAHRRPEGVHHQRFHRRGRAGDGPHRRARGEGCLGVPGADRRPTASPRTRCTASSGCAPATPPSSCSTASRSVPRRCSAARATGSRSRCRRWTTAGCRSPPRAPASAQAALDIDGRPTPARASSSASRSPVTSWCRR